MYRFLYPPGEEGSLITSSNFKIDMKLKSRKMVTFTANDLFESIFDHVKNVTIKHRPISSLVSHRDQLTIIKDWYLAANRMVVSRSKDTMASIGLKVIDYNEYSATSCHINDEGQLVIRLSPAYWHHYLKSMVPNSTFSIPTYLAFKFCNLSDGPYLAFPCMSTKRSGDGGNGETATTTIQSVSYNHVLRKAGIHLTLKPFDSSETAIYLIHGVTDENIKLEFILDNEHLKNQPLEIKFNILRKDSKIPIQTTYTNFSEKKKTSIYQYQKNNWMFNLFTSGKMSDFTVNREDKDGNNKFILQCKNSKEDVHVNLDQDDILLILPDSKHWNKIEFVSKAFSFSPYISGTTATQEFNQTIKTAFGSTEIDNFKFCVLNSKDRIHKLVELISAAPFQKPRQILCPVWGDVDGYFYFQINQLIKIIKSIKNNYILVRNALGFTEGTLSNYNMEGVLTLVDYSIVKKDETIGKFDLLQYIQKVDQIDKKKELGYSLFSNLKDVVYSILLRMETKSMDESEKTPRTLFIKGHIVSCDSEMFKQHCLTEKRSIDAL